MIYSQLLSIEVTLTAFHVITIQYFHFLPSMVRHEYIYLLLRSISIHIFPIFLTLSPSTPISSTKAQDINLVFSRGGGQDKYSGEEAFMEEDGEAGFSSGSLSLDGDEGSHDGHHPTLRPHFS